MRYVAPQRPDDAPENNWLPTAAGQPYVLRWRFVQTRSGEGGAEVVTTGAEEAMNDVGTTWMLPFAPSVTETTAG